VVVEIEMCLVKLVIVLVPIVVVWRSGMLYMMGVEIGRCSLVAMLGSSVFSIELVVIRLGSLVWFWWVSVINLVLYLIFVLGWLSVSHDVIIEVGVAVICLVSWRLMKLIGSMSVVVCR